MFAEVPQPLRYAEALLGRYAELAGAASAESLLAGLVRAAAELADCFSTALHQENLGVIWKRLGI